MLFRISEWLVSPVGGRAQPLCCVPAVNLNTGRFYKELETKDTIVVKKQNSLNTEQQSVGVIGRTLN